MLSFIIWDVAPQIFTIPEFSFMGRTFGPIGPVWYGLLFATAFLLGQFIITKIYKIEGKSELQIKQVETLTLYMIAATVIGARLGHCIFYEPQDFFWSPDKLIKILYIWNGGLASHGAGIAILITIWIYCRKYPKEKYLYILDRMAIIAALAACLIRFGNLMNSEIIGVPTEASQGFIFVNSTTSYLKERNPQIVDIDIKQNNTDTTFEGLYLKGIDIKMKIKSFGNGELKEFAEQGICQTIQSINNDGDYHSDRTHIVIFKMEGSATVGAQDRKGTDVTIKAWGVPRHPAQLYESVSSLILFFILLFVYSKKKGETPHGLLFGIFMVWIFTLRFCYEFVKENQVNFENNMSLNMGQLLSIPMVIIGIIVLIKAIKNNKV